MSEREADEPSDWYGSWLSEAAGGKKVRTGPLFLVWVGLVAVVAAVVYLAGGRTESTYLVPIGLVSAPYWFLAVPTYVRKRYRDR